MTETYTPAIGDAIDTAEKFNALPIGATLTDHDGWVHTKVTDWVSGQGIQATTYVDHEHDEEGTFAACFRWGTTLTSLPGEPVEEPLVQEPTLQEQLDQALAAQAMEASRANEAEARAARLQQALNYAVSVSGKRVQGRVLGYIDRINQAEA